MTTATTSITMGGCYETIKGVCEISDGNFEKGSMKVIAGLTTINFAAKWSMNNEFTISKIMQYSLECGATVVMTKGAITLVDGIKKEILEVQFLVLCKLRQAVLPLFI